MKNGWYLLLQIAKTHLLSRKKQTITAALGVTFGIGTFIILVSFMTGLNGLLDGLILNRTPHIHLFNEIKQSPQQPAERLATLKGSHLIHSIKPKQSQVRIHNAIPIIQHLRKEEQVKGVSPQVQAQVFYMAGATELNGVINGIEIAEEVRLFNFDEYIISGSPEELMKNANGILLGAGIAEKMSLDVGVSQYPAALTAKAVTILKKLGTPLLIHQPRYSMFDRWVEKGLMSELENSGVGAIAFSPLEQGILTNKYLKGFPKKSRAVKDGRYLKKDQITPEILEKVRQLNEIAQNRNQTLAQMAIAWLLKDPRITSVLVGVSSPKQMQDNADTVKNLNFSEEELEKIEKILV